LYVNVPVFNGRAFDSSALQLIFGIGLGIYFAHMGVGNFAKLSLRRDPSGRSLIWRHVACVAFVMVLSSIWMLALNGAIAPALLASETGTALVPLAAQLGPSVQLFGSILVVLSMGMGSIFFSTRGRFLLSISPIMWSS
jgi:hypothetical protein